MYIFQKAGFKKYRTHIYIYKSHGCIRRNPISTGQIEKKQQQNANFKRDEIFINDDI